jgi:hypothetical protein
MCDSVEKAIKKCSAFLGSFGKGVKCCVRPYSDDIEDESGYSLTLSVRQADGAWYVVDSSHRFPTNGMSIDDTAEDIKRVVRHRLAIGYSLTAK